MGDLGKTWIEVFKKYFTHKGVVCCNGIMPWNIFKEFEATMTNFNAYVLRYKVDDKMENVKVYLTNEMIKFLENEINRKE